MGGTDEYIHNGQISGVFRELGNALVRSQKRPTVQRMQSIYDELESNAPELMRRAGANSLFEARVFGDLVLFAAKHVEMSRK